MYTYLGAYVPEIILIIIYLYISHAFQVLFWSVVERSLLRFWNAEDTGEYREVYVEVYVLLIITRSNVGDADGVSSPS